VAIDSAAARYLIVHELAHAMAGLADEYYLPAGDGPAYRGNIEPWQPNATLAPERGKWRDLLSGPPRPTPWNKTEYERRFADYVRRYDRLRASGADEGVVEKLMQDERGRQAALLARGGEARQAGYFEGANGYRERNVPLRRGLHHVLIAVGVLLPGLCRRAQPGDRWAVRLSWP
jgi:hypothetical protein